jgi:hypothetical protein
MKDMRKLVFNQHGNILVTLMVVSTLTITGLMGLMQVAANYSTELKKERKATSLPTKKEIALDYVLSKFTSRSMANGNQGAEWSISNNSDGMVRVSVNTSYCYQPGCTVLSDPVKAPIRDVYRRWTIVNGTRMCVSVTPYQEFQGSADPTVHCAPFYDDYVKDASNLASLQTPATLDANEKQKAYFTLLDLEKFSKTQQDRYLAGTLSTTDIFLGLTPLRVTFISYQPKVSPDPDIITVAFDDGEQGRIMVPKEVVTAEFCGNPQLDNSSCLATKAAKFCGCYDKSDVMASGKARLSDGTEIVLYQTGGNFKVWKEKNGNRILKPTGLWASHSDWQKMQTRSGTAFTTTNFTNVSQIAGRACPTNVFLSHNLMVATDRCIYYDLGNMPQRLDLASSGTEATDFLNRWDSVNSGRAGYLSYYEGNIKTCADKGMRLPTIYETTIYRPGNAFLPGAQADGYYNADGIFPIFSTDSVSAGNSFVPSVEGVLTWTATAAGFAGGNAYWNWVGQTSGGFLTVYNWVENAVRCVLPSS